MRTPANHFTSKPLLFGEGIGQDDCIMYWNGRWLYAIAGGEESVREPGGYDLQINWSDASDSYAHNMQNGI